MSPDEIRARIREYLADTVMFRREVVLTDSASLVKAGVLDSLAMLGLIAFLEETFEVKVSDDEVEPENLGSIDALAAFVARKRAAGDQAA